QGDLATAIGLVLFYYDKTYRYDLEQRQPPLHTLEVTGLDAQQAAQRLRQAAYEAVPLSDRVSKAG
ncbi:MAG: tRNA 2-selenouridine(34) synthase MnmH, partial [Cyanobacteria bacterium P01_A01_bin.135]